VSKKNCTPKAGWHIFIKISLPMMIFHTFSCESIELEKFSTGRVPAARFT